jgi:hypothetical protein
MKAEAWSFAGFIIQDFVCRADNPEGLTVTLIIYAVNATLLIYCFYGLAYQHQRRLVSEIIINRRGLSFMGGFHFCQALNSVRLNIILNDGVMSPHNRIRLL